MISPMPRSDDQDRWDETFPPAPQPSRPGQAARAVREPVGARAADRAARAHWDEHADSYQAEHGSFLAGWRGPSDSAGSSEVSAFVWGPEGRTEAELGLLGPLAALAGRRVLEVGCGAAQCSRWLADRGVAAVGIDVSHAQLRHATTAHWRGPPRVAQATATALPFADAAFDAAFSAYGAVQFVADLDRLLAEVARVLRPGGRWAFSVTHPVRWAFPDEPGGEGLAVSGSYFDRTPYVERDATGTAVYAEFHRTLGDYVASLTGAGLGVDTVVEPEWPDWNGAVWGGWSPLRGAHLPGTLIVGCRRGRS